MKTLLITLLLSGFANAKRLHLESWYQHRVAKLWGAEKEVTVANGRVDIVGKNYATEVEFADKWKGSIGQALWYAMQTGKKPGIILICEKKRDYLHALRLKSVLNNSKLKIRIWTVKIVKEKIQIKDF